VLEGEEGGLACVRVRESVLNQPMRRAFVYMRAHVRAHMCASE